MNDWVFGFLSSVENRHGYVFRFPNGRKTTVDCISGRFKRACRAIGLSERLHFHSVTQGPHGSSRTVPQYRQFRKSLDIPTSRRNFELARSLLRLTKSLPLLRLCAHCPARDNTAPLPGINYCFIPSADSFRGSVRYTSNTDQQRSSGLNRSTKLGRVFRCCSQSR